MRGQHNDEPVSHEFFEELCREWVGYKRGEMAEQEVRRMCDEVLHESLLPWFYELKAEEYFVAWKFFKQRVIAITREARAGSACLKRCCRYEVTSLALTQSSDPCMR